MTDTLDSRDGRSFVYDPNLLSPSFTENDKESGDTNHKNELSSKEEVAHQAIKSSFQCLAHLCQDSDENKILSQTIHLLSENYEQLGTELKTIEDIKRKKGEDRSLSFYLQEKKILGIINKAIAVNSNTATSLWGLCLDDIESVRQITQTEFDIENSEDRSRTADILANIVSEQSAEAIRYSTSKDFFIDSQLDFLNTQKIIIDHLRLQEPPIRAEYYQKMRDIISEFNKTPFYKIASTIKRFRSLVVSNSNNSTFGTILDKITKIREFNIEEFAQHPDYLISKHYLIIINSWVDQYLLNQKRNDWLMIITGDPKLRSVSKLADKLFENIHPTLQASWMKELRPSRRKMWFAILNIIKYFYGFTVFTSL